jgi:hypothetical protein
MGWVVCVGVGEGEGKGINGKDEKEAKLAVT